MFYEYFCWKVNNKCIIDHVKILLNKLIERFSNLIRYMQYCENIVFAGLQLINQIIQP